MKNIVSLLLKYITVLYLKMNPTEIIAVTGTVGKTTTRKAIVTVLKEKFKVNDFQENSYNTEIGVPLSIFGQKIPNYKILWPWVLLKCFVSAFFLKFDKLVIEMGADRKGDLDYLLSFIRPDISVITWISEVHLDQFRNIKAIFNEKLKIIEVLSEQNTAILNFDNDLIRKLKLKTKARVLGYAINNEAEVKLTSIKTSAMGTDFTLIYDNKIFNARVNLLGKHSLYSLLAGVAVGLVYGLNEEELKKAFFSFSPVKGRMNLIKGINGSNLIDDSYNSSPASVIEALKTLKEIAPKRKIAVLGTMNEMGDFFIEAHRNVGKAALDDIDIIIAVGEGGKVIGQELQERGLNTQKLFFADDSEEAGNLLTELITENDTILFKGSQKNVRLEKAIKKVMAFPEMAKNVLVRQDKVWERKD